MTPSGATREKKGNTDMLSPAQDIDIEKGGSEILEYSMSGEVKGNENWKWIELMFINIKVLYLFYKICT